MIYKVNISGIARDQINELGKIAPYFKYNDIYISPKSIEDIKNWFPSEEQTQKVFNNIRTCSSWNLFNKGCTCKYLKENNEKTI